MFTGLGDLPGGRFSSEPAAVSADGSVVVGRSTNQGVSDTEAFRWTEATGMVGLGDLFGGEPPNSQAFDVSADGSVVVGNSLAAFRWTASTGMEAIGLNFGLGVSADGSVVVGGDFLGSVGDPPQLQFEGFRWEGGVLTALGDLPGGITSSLALDVSGDGSIVVGSSNSTSGEEAFRWTQAGGIVGLGSLPGGSSFSQAFDVSADGSVIVGRSESASGNEASRWTAGGGMVGLGDLAGGGFSSRAEAVSADGSVIVGSGLSASDREAAIWDATNGMRELDQILIGLGLDLTGWTLEFATAISADARTVVGTGTNPSGNTEAWLARIPLPDEFAALPGGVQSTSLGGGTGTPGGLDITLDSLDGGTVIGEYFTPTASEINEQFDLDQIPNFQLPGPSTAQFWELDFVGTLTDDVTVTFSYDESLLAGLPEASLIILHLLEGGGAEIFQSGAPGFSIDAAANTITLTTSSLSPFVLGIVPEPGTGLLVSLGFVVLAFRRRRTRL